MTTTKTKLNSLKKIAPRASVCAMASATALSLIPATVRADDPPSHLNQLLNLEFANEYVTPRGMIVRDTGLTFQPLELTFINLYKGDGFINDFTADAGCWNDFGTHPIARHGNGAPGSTAWTEVDPIAGVSVSFAKNFTLGVTYSAFAEQILDIGTSQNLEIKMSYDDTGYLKAFALHPYFSFWDELQSKATDADLPAAIDFGGGPRKGAKHPQPGPSYYFEFGVDPSYSFTTLAGLKLEAPCRIMFPNERFYGDYFASSSTVGLFEVGLKASVPVSFMPAGYGHWGFHVGVKLLDFVDDNLYRLNIFNQPGKNVRDTVQVYCGASVFF
jgi:hypothetical protein